MHKFYFVYQNLNNFLNLSRFNQSTKVDYTKGILKTLYLILFITFLWVPRTDGQTPQKIHDLKSLTDSTGTVHLFYRIYAEYEGTEYFTDNIYHYNTDTGVEELFLEHFYDTRYGFPFNNRILDFKFLENNLENYVYIINADMHTYISRSDSTELIGGHLVTFDHLNAEGTDSGMVYVEMLGEVIIGKNGGRNWPDADAENFEEIPDSSKLDFPLISLSPYNDSLMFGRRSFQRDGENAFLRSNDKGLTTELISDTLLPNQIQFDLDSSTIYAFARIGAEDTITNCSIDPCSYGLFVNHSSGEAGAWMLKKSFSNKINSTEFPTITTNPREAGKLYLWNNESILVSDNYGEQFDALSNPNEGITGFTATATDEYYSTISTLYKLEGGQSVEIFSIPVSREFQTELPKHNELLQNYPNPFNPVTTITFQMRKQDAVKIDLYTITGRWIKELINEYKMEGTYRIQLDGSDLSSGTYIIKARLGERIQSNTITLIK